MSGDKQALGDRLQIEVRRADEHEREQTTRIAQQQGQIVQLQGQLVRDMDRVYMWCDVMDWCAGSDGETQSRTRRAHSAGDASRT